MIISTGSQGEPMSALSRIAARNHDRIAIEPGDTVVLASSLIPGNENSVFRVMNGLTRLGATVVHRGQRDWSTSPGTRARASCSTATTWCVRATCCRSTARCGTWWRTPTWRCRPVFRAIAPCVAEDGIVVDLVDGVAQIAGRVDCGLVFVDGSSVGDITESELKDRRILGEEGFISVMVVLDSDSGKIIAGPGDPCPRLRGGRAASSTSSSRWWQMR